MTVSLLVIAIAQSGYTGYFGVNVTTVTGMNGYPRGESNTEAIINYLKEQLEDLQSEGWKIFVFADNENQSLRIKEILKNYIDKP